MDEAFLTGQQVRQDEVTGRVYPGLGPDPGPGVLVLHGAGGAGGYERAYAARLAEHGYTTLCVDYFGAPGVSDILESIPLEYFRDAAEWLLDRPDVTGDRVGVLGFSRGGEAALLVGTEFDAVGAVVAYVPSCYAFQAPSWMDGVGENRPTWTLEGSPVPYLRIDEYVDDDEIDDPLGVTPPNPVALALERAPAAETDRATIEVERIDAPVLLVSGGKDTLWPSTTLANRVIDRLERHDHPYPFDHLAFADAGHAIRVPYRFDGRDAPESRHEYGGTNAANAYAAATAWRGTLEYLREGVGE